MRTDAPEGTRAAIGVSSRRRVTRLVSAALLVALLALVAPAQALAVGNTLSDGSVNPTTGIIATTFAFQVDYTSDQGFEATSVWAEVAGMTVTLLLVSGTAVDGTFSGGSTLPAGSWPVTFHADAVRGSDPALAGPTLTVIDPNATPPPTPIPAPAPTPNPPPTPTQPPSGTVAPGPGTPQSPFVSSAPSATSRGRPSETPGASDLRAPTPEPSTEEADPDDASTRLGNPWLFVGGGMSAIGAAILLGNWAGRRRRRPARP